MQTFHYQALWLFISHSPYQALKNTLRENGDVPVANVSMNSTIGTVKRALA